VYFHLTRSELIAAALRARPQNLFAAAFGGVTEPSAGNGRRVYVKFAVGTIKPTLGLRRRLRRHGPSCGLGAGSTRLVLWCAWIT